jgi:Mu-like prophage I protein
MVTWSWSSATASTAKREVIFLHSVGAVRNGAIPGLEFSLNSADAGSLATLFSNLTTNSTDTTTMPDFKALLIKVLGLASDASDDDITKAAEAEAKTETMGSEPETNAAKVKLLGLEAEVASLKTLVAGIQTNSAAIERASLTAQAAREGKMIPASALTGDLQLNNAQLAALIKDLPVTVPVEQRTIETNSVQASGVLELNSAAEQVRKQLGYTADEWAKLGK